MKIRGFEFVDDEYKKVKVEDTILPQRGTKKSAGYDFYSTSDVVILPGEKVLIWTDIKVYMQDDEALKLFIRSSIGIKRSLVLANQTGIIDADYYNNPDNDGNIGICIRNMGTEFQVIKKGEAIAQCMFSKYLISDNCNTDNERTGGIGSTTK